MNTGKTLAERMQMLVARTLVKGPVPSLILAGTLAFAGLSAASMGGSAGASEQQTPSITGSNCHPDPDGDGHTVCTVDSSQLARYAGAHCFADYNIDGQYTCYIDNDDR